MAFLSLSLVEHMFFREPRLCWQSIIFLRNCTRHTVVWVGKIQSLKWYLLTFVRFTSYSKSAKLGTSVICNIMIAKPWRLLGRGRFVRKSPTIIIPPSPLVRQGLNGCTRSFSHLHKILMKSVLNFRYKHYSKSVVIGSLPVRANTEHALHALALFASDGWYKVR